MEKSNFSIFINNLITIYQKAEDYIGAKYIQDQTPKTIGHVITLTSLAALGYFGAEECNRAFLGAGVIAGAMLSCTDINQYLSSLKEGALIPMDKDGYFAFQKICAIAILLGANYAPLTGFFAGNAAYHYAKSFL